MNGTLALAGLSFGCTLVEVSRPAVGNSALLETVGRPVRLGSGPRGFGLPEGT